MTPRHPIAGLLVAQFFGAFNDNAFKMLVALLAIAAVQQDGEAAVQRVTTLTFAVFTLPLIVFCLPAMWLGDRVGKRDLVVWTKLLEVVLMAAGTLALLAVPTGLLPLLVLAGMGAQSALFAPAKYGILPELLPHEKLSRGNGLLELCSFVAIVLGTIAGGLLLKGSDGRPWLAGVALTAFAGVGYVAALRVPKTPRAGAAEDLRAVVSGAWRAIRADRALWLATLGSLVFWGLVSLLGQDVLVYSKQVLGLGDQYAGAPYALFAIGIGGGSVLAGRWSRGGVETGLIPLGAIALALGTGALGLFGPGIAGTLLLMTLLGVGSGFVVVPINALIQWRSPGNRRGAVIALINGLGFVGIFFGNVACDLLARLGADSRDILVIAAALTLLATLWAVWLLPQALLRLTVVLATHTLYRVRVLGREHVPQEGGALLVPNHVSFLDALFLLAAIDRPIRFVVEQYWYERPYLRPFLKAMAAIPIAGSGGPRVVLRALREAGDSLDRGDLVCMFAEGEISRMGSTLPFRRGLQRLLKGRTAPIVPAHLGQVYGGLLSARQGRVRWLPTRVPCPMSVSFGAPLPPDSEPAEVRRRVDELAAPAFAARRPDLRPLHHRLLRSMRRRPWATAFLDGEGRRLSRLSVVAAAVVLARRLRAHWREPRVGLLLPPSCAGGMAAIAASLAGRTAVPLNYTAGTLGLGQAARRAELRTVLTSRTFLQALQLELPPELSPLFVEDVLQGVPAMERLGAVLRALLLPRRGLERACGAAAPVHLDDPAVVIFSSGSTGEPKGVVLSHCNVQANCDAVAQVLPLSGDDRLLGVLPLFHSFGNLALWYALQQGCGIVWHPNPLDAAAVGDLVARHRITILLATPTFLQLYLRRCEPGQFGSLRLVLTGAEKLTDALADEFHDRFGIRPVQGYGTTECAPVVAVATQG